MIIKYLGHSCFILKSSDGSICFDPFSPRAVPGVPDVPNYEVEAVLCSHGHGDHSYAEAMTLSGKVFSGVITSVQSFHDENQGKDRGLNTISVVKTEGKTICHMGDIGHILSDEQCKAIGTPDVILIPVGGTFTVNGENAAKICNQLKAKKVIPMHYKGKGFGYDVITDEAPFMQAMKEYSGEIILLKYGEELSL